MIEQERDATAGRCTLLNRDEPQRSVSAVGGWLGTQIKNLLFQHPESRMAPRIGAEIVAMAWECLFREAKAVSAVGPPATSSNARA